MLLLKCIWGGILGAIFGAFVTSVSGLAIYIIVGLLTWNSNTGEAWAIISLLAIPISMVMGILEPIREEQRKQRIKDALRQKEEDERMEEEKAHQQAIEEERNRQQEYERTLSTILDNLASESSLMAQKLPGLVRSAESALNLAEHEFEEGVLDPFWDAVEKAATELATFESNVQEIIASAEFYRAESSKLPQRPSSFQLGVHTLPDAVRTATRMRSIIRRTQNNPAYSQIYHLRKTNQLLVDGFSTFGQAINVLGDRLDSSLGRLSSDFSISISKLADTQRDNTLILASELRLLQQQAESNSEDLVSELKLAREQAESDSEARQEHEKEERKMLDNIQRRRKPLPPSYRDGEY